MTSPPLVTIENLSLNYHSREVIHPALININLSIKAGETLGLVGESGSGKSTLAHALLNLLPPQAKIHSGKITAFNQEIKQHSSESNLLRGQDISMIFQDPMTSLTPHMTILEQMIEPLIHVHHISKEQAKLKARNLLESVELPNPDLVLKKYPHELSGGMSQRVMIAIALSSEPKLLIADEPTTALDVTTQATILKIIKKLQQEQNMALLFVSHDLGVIHQVCDRICVMNKGKLVEEGTAMEVLSQPKENYTQGLIASIPRLKGEKLEQLPSIAPIEMPPKPDISTTNILSVKDLLVEYTSKGLFSSSKPFKAVNSISFQMNEGEILGIVGESGSGKSTTAKAISGLIPYQSGEVQYRSKRLNGLHPEIQMIFQDPASSLNPRMNIGRNIAEGLIYKKTHSKEDIFKKCIELLKLVDLPEDYYHRYPHELSGGQKQRIGIARALASAPKLLICDEPVSALDVSIQAQVLNLLKKLQRSLNLSMLFITHDISVVRFIADKLIVMKTGEIVEAGQVDSLLENPKETYTRTLLSSVPQMDF